MNSGQNRISNTQFIFAIIAFIQGSTVWLSFVDGIAKQDAWLVVIAALAASIPFVLCYALLAKQFPGKNLIQMNELIYGTYLGMCISILYSFYFFSLIFLNLRGLANFYIDFILPETPMSVLVIMITVVSAYAVRSGIEVIVRIGMVFMLISISIVAVTSMLLLKDMKISNFLPVFVETPLKVYIQGMHFISAVPFCEILIFLMVIPYLNDFTNAKKDMLSGLILGACGLVVIAVRNTAVLGIVSSIQNASSYQAARLIDFGNVLTRLELLIAIGVTSVIFFKIVVLYYGTVVMIAQVLRLRTCLPLIFPFGGMAITNAIIAFPSTVEHGYWGSSIAAVYVSPFLFIFPPLSLLIARIRGLPKKEECK